MSLDPRPIKACLGEQSDQQKTPAAEHMQCRCFFAGGRAQSLLPTLQPHRAAFSVRHLETRLDSVLFQCAMREDRGASLEDGLDVGLSLVQQHRSGYRIVGRGAVARPLH
jgi:hypothetical protein